MKVVFLEDVEGTAAAGDVREVANGYARNFLLPRGIAVAPTEPNLQKARSLMQKETRRQEKLDSEAAVYIEKLENYVVTFEARVGETGQLFGSVTSRDIAARIQETTDIEVNQKMILLGEPIRQISTQSVTIRFTRNTSIVITVNVEPDEVSRPIVERLRVEAEAAELEAKQVEAEAQELMSRQAAVKAEEEAAKQAAEEASELAAKQEEAEAAELAAKQAEAEAAVITTKNNEDESEENT